MELSRTALWEREVLKVRVVEEEELDGGTGSVDAVPKWRCIVGRGERTYDLARAGISAMERSKFESAGLASREPVMWRLRDGTMAGSLEGVAVKDCTVRRGALVRRADAIIADSSKRI